MFRIFYIGNALLVLVAYAFGAVNGCSGTPERQVIPADVRHAAGGYRSFHFWHSGYQGGK
ncbi:MAG: hypothetical protein IT381_04525 [Deltaproteobacteria bacterium]|nr:hypothetical protein [Deltaproteobacteria bacterium]